VSQAIEFPVKFGKVSIGAGTMSVSVVIERTVCNINSADDIFCGHRLKGRIVLGRSGDQPGQQTIVDDLDEAIDAIFDVKSINVKQERFSATLNLSKADNDANDLGKFASATGRIIIDEVGELPDDAEGDEEDDSDESDESLKAEGPWADVPLSDLFENSLLKKLQAAKLVTVGDLANFSANPDNRLTDLEGIGPGMAGKIEDRMLQFWQSNPDAELSLIHI
jgi:hypothetical protein